MPCNVEHRDASPFSCSLTMRVTGRPDQFQRARWQFLTPRFEEQRPITHGIVLRIVSADETYIDLHHPTSNEVVTPAHRRKSREPDDLQGPVDRPIDTRPSSRKGCYVMQANSSESTLHLVLQSSLATLPFWPTFPQTPCSRRWQKLDWPAKSGRLYVEVGHAATYRPL